MDNALEWLQIATETVKYNWLNNNAMDAKTAQ
jgi:hypothetical protein